jgi:DNA polymerase elongation subunit (family B)
MLVDIQYVPHKEQLITSYVDEDGNIKLKYFKYDNPVGFESCNDSDTNKHPNYKTWYGKPIKFVPTTRPDRYSMYYFLDNLPEAEQKELFEYHEPKPYFVDIETEITDGFPDPVTAPNTVTAISIVFEDKIILMGIKELTKEEQSDILKDTNEYFKKLGLTYKMKYIQYADEFDMLKDFFYTYVPKMSFISGWNFVDFDWVYLVNRVRKINKVINGRICEIDPNVASFTRRLVKQTKDSNVELPMHRVVMDYMKLYNIFDTSIKVKESSSLDFVSEKLIGVGKIKYDGSLQKLYETDFKKFMYYNCVDSVLVHQIHLKCNYVSIAYAIACLANIKLTDVLSKMEDKLGSIAVTEGVLRKRFLAEDVILFRDPTYVDNSLSAGFAGGYVKEPIVGMNMWNACYDFSSLYPTTMRQFFISPENYRGIQMKDKMTHTLHLGKEILIDYNIHTVLVNGCVFEKNNSPTIKMLTDIFADRKKYKKMMLNKKEEVKKLQDELNALEKSL